MRAVVVDPAGRPRLQNVAEPEGPGELVRVRACGLCGSDVEKLTPDSAGSVLGHEVVVETAGGGRAVLVHHLPCGDCDRCRAGHESTCAEFRKPTIVPGGFAERVAARGGSVELPDPIPDSVATYAEPLACVLRGAERIRDDRVLVLGGGFIGRLFAAVLRARGSHAHVYDRDLARSDGEPPRRFPLVVVAASADPLPFVEPGGTILVFAPLSRLDAERVYRDELTVTGSRSSTPRHLEQAVALLPDLELPEPTVLPLDRFGEGLELYRTRRAMKVVFTP